MFYDETWGCDRSGLWGRKIQFFMARLVVVLGPEKVLIFCIYLLCAIYSVAMVTSNLGTRECFYSINSDMS